MTAAARISQADMDRAIRAAAKAENARVVFRLDKREIEVIIGESGNDSAPEEWSDDD